MKLLSFDLAPEQGEFCLWNTNQNIEDALRVTLPPRASKELHFILQTHLDNLGWYLADIDLVALNTGPGSFTGLRLASTFARSLVACTASKEKEVRLHGVTQEAALLRNDFSESQELNQGDLISWAVNARRGKVNRCLIEWQSDGKHKLADQLTQIDREQAFEIYKTKQCALFLGEAFDELESFGAPVHGAKAMAVSVALVAFEAAKAGAGASLKENDLDLQYLRHPVMGFDDEAFK
jgi:tRNA A37 threonylcarbamoyladenosine modification protein TsaB